MKEIRRLLWDQKFTIQGACEQLRKNRPRHLGEKVSQPELPFSVLDKSVVPCGSGSLGNCADSTDQQTFGDHIADDCDYKQEQYADDGRQLWMNRAKLFEH